MACITAAAWGTARKHCSRPAGRFTKELMAHVATTIRTDQLSRRAARCVNTDMRCVMTFFCMAARATDTA
jgi:hypothetical protein